MERDQAGIKLDQNFYLGHGVIYFFVLNFYSEYM